MKLLIILLGAAISSWGILKIIDMYREEHPG